MKNNKYHILVIGYTSIRLFSETNGKITNINFSNGKNVLSNCVTFSYDREDLEYLPDGDPFEVNQNSAYSDYLDFAGYHFDAKEALETIVKSIIDNKLIPNLGKNEDIFLFLQTFRYEGQETKTNRSVMSIVDKDIVINGHHLYAYDSDLLITFLNKSILDVIGANLLMGYPFQTHLFIEEEKGISTIFAPTLEKTVVDKVTEQYPLPTHIPEKLLRNVTNKIITSKLLGLPLPKEAVYQNRKVDIAKTTLSKRFDEILKEDARYFIERTDKVKNGPTFVFDFGMHPVIKESFLTCIEKPIFMEKEYNDLLTAFLLRFIIVEHIMDMDPIFKKEAVRVNKEKKDIAFFKVGSTIYYDMPFIEAYIKRFNKKNVLSNLESKEIESICKSKLESIKKQLD